MHFCTYFSFDFVYLFVAFDSSSEKNERNIDNLYNIYIYGLIVDQNLLQTQKSQSIVQSIWIEANNKGLKVRQICCTNPNRFTSVYITSWVLIH